MREEHRVYEGGRGGGEPESGVAASRPGLREHEWEIGPAPARSVTGPVNGTGFIHTDSDYCTPTCQPALALRTSGAAGTDIRRKRVLMLETSGIRRCGVPSKLHYAL